MNDTSLEKHLGGRFQWETECEMKCLVMNNTRNLGKYLRVYTERVGNEQHKPRKRFAWSAVSVQSNIALKWSGGVYKHISVLYQGSTVILWMRYILVLSQYCPVQYFNRERVEFNILYFSSQTFTDA